MGTLLSSRVAALEKLAGHSAEEWQALMAREGITPELQQEIVEEAIRAAEASGDPAEYASLIVALADMEPGHATV